MRVPSVKLTDKTFERNDSKITSKFGWRKDPFTGVESFHQGVDYGTQLQNWLIYGIEEGTVLASNSDATNGHYIWVAYPRINLKIFYCHLDRRFVTKGEKVNGKTMLGMVGTSGRSTNIHLHMGVKHISTDKYFDHETYDYKPLYENIRVGDKVTIEGEFTVGVAPKNILDKTRSHLKL